MVSLLNWTSIFEWYMTWHVVKNIQLKHMFYKILGCGLSIVTFGYQSNGVLSHVSSFHV